MTSIVHIHSKANHNDVFNSDSWLIVWDETVLAVTYTKSKTKTCVDTWNSSLFKLFCQTDVNMMVTENLSTPCNSTICCQFCAFLSTWDSALELCPLPSITAMSCLEWYFCTPLGCGYWTKDFTLPKLSGNSWGCSPGFHFWATYKLMVIHIYPARRIQRNYRLIEL